MNRRFFLALIGLTLGASASAFAADEKLYNPAPPPNSVFFRVIDARGQGNMQVSVNNIAISVPDTGVSAYVVVPAGDRDVQLSTATSHVKLIAGKYYTLALFADASTQPKLIEDPILDNPAKSGVYFYNFTDAPTLKLFAPDQKVAVVDAVKQNSGGFKAVNAVTVKLAVMDGDKTVASFDQVELKRRTGMTAVAFGTGAEKKAIVVPSETVR